MKDGPDIAALAALIGDPARANMLTALMAGRALTARELASEAGVTPQTASAHLKRLVDGALIRPRKQGRHKYFELASDEAAAALEALMGLAARAGRLRTRPGPKDADLRRARVCYDHLAGEMGAQMYDALLAKGWIDLTDAEPTLTPAGDDGLEALGVDVATLRRGRARLCRTCLDWSERRSHLAGSVGRALLAAFEAKGWAARADGSRAVRFTPRGAAAFADAFPAEPPRVTA